MIENKGVKSVCRVENDDLGNDANERRQHRRVNVEQMEVHCGMPSASQVKIMDIGNGGALVMADRAIEIGKNYALTIGYKDKVLLVKATAVWALLADRVKKANGDIIPLYIAGMKFVDVVKDEIQEIIRLLEDNMKGTMYDAFMGSLVVGNA